MPKVDPKYLLQGLLDRGLQPHQAAGVMGNIALENSQFDTGAKEQNPMTESARKQGGGFGLMQWTAPERKQGLYNFANMQGKPVDDPDVQLDYFMEEMKGSHKKAMKALEMSSNPRQAAFAVSRHYEIPSKKYAHNDKRMSAAEQFFKLINPIGEAQADEIPQGFDPVEYKQFLDSEAQQQPQQESSFDPEEYKQFLEQEKSNSEPRLGQEIAQGITDIGAGVLKGASNIGNTLLSAGDTYNELVGNKNALSNLDSTGEQRRQEMTQALQDQGANTDSTAFNVGEIGTEIAGAAGVGNALAAGAKSIPVISKLAEPIATAGMKGKIAEKVIGGGISGAAQTGLVSGSPKDAGTGALVGMALPPTLAVANKAGSTIGSGLGKAGKAIMPELSKEVKDLAIKAKSYGIDIPLDRLYDSKPLNALASGLNYVPMSGRAGTEEKIAKQLNKAVSKTIGQDTHNITKALRDAKTVLSQKFDDTLKNNSVNIDKKLVDELGKIQSNTSRIFGGEVPKTIQAQLDEIVKTANNGVLDGENAYRIKRELDRMGKGSSNEAFHFREIKDSLMKTLNRSLGADKAKEFSKVREQYSNMLTLEKLAKNGAEGDISIARLANIKKPKSKELQDLADIAAQFVKAREGQHGSAQRAAAAAITLGTAGAPALATGAAVGNMANKLLNSKTLRDKATGSTTKQLLAKRDNLLNLLAQKSAPLVVTKETQE